jgi:hypothetical protein
MTNTTTPHQSQGTAGLELLSWKMQLSNLGQETNQPTDFPYYLSAPEDKFFASTTPLVMAASFNILSNSLFVYHLIFPSYSELPIASLNKRHIK